MRKHLRLLAIAGCLAVLPFGVAFGASAASSTTTVTKVIDRQPFPDAACKRATGHTGCYVVETLTQPADQNIPLLSLLVHPASAYSGCYGPFTLVQTVYSSIGTAMAAGDLRMQVCWNPGPQVTIPFMQCWVTGTALYGGGVNYCYSPAYPGVMQSNPTWAEEGWYFYPYPMPWWHINNVQEWGVYTTGVALWYSCTYC
jgi:hypothetical protein